MYVDAIGAFVPVIKLAVCHARAIKLPSYNIQCVLHTNAFSITATCSILFEVSLEQCMLCVHFLGCGQVVELVPEQAGMD